MAENEFKKAYKEAKVLYDREAIIEKLLNEAPDQEGVDDLIALINELPPVQLSCDKCAMNGSDSKYCENCQPSIHRDRTVQDFVDKCRECGRIRKGHWIAHSDGGIWIKYYECSECRTRYDTHTKFCPNCGAKMVEEQTE